MLQLNSNGRSPSAATLRHLAGKQADIDGQATPLRVKRANNLWDTKQKARAGKLAFTEVRGLLVNLCVGTKLCNYCEHNEADDIEHIYPKSVFPERTFQWPNYLLACKCCNTNYKLDQFAVFNPAQSVMAEAVQRGRALSSTDAAFIDPRQEDPLHYLQLDIQGKTFFFIPNPHRTDLRDIAKAEHTLNVLQIATRPTLVDGRKRAFRYFQDQLEQYQKVRDATTWQELEQLTRDPEWVDRSNRFEVEQQLMLVGLKQNIVGHQHPTVWREMQRQYHWLPATGRLFAAVPEALQW